MTKKIEEKKSKKEQNKGFQGEIYIPRKILVEKIFKAIEQRNLIGWWGLWKKK